MTPGELKRISELWDVLAELPAGDREQWLLALDSVDAAHLPALREMLSRRDGTADGLSMGAPTLADDFEATHGSAHIRAMSPGPSGCCASWVAAAWPKCGWRVPTQGR